MSSCRCSSRTNRILRRCKNRVSAFYSSLFIFKEKGKMTCPAGYQYIHPRAQAYYNVPECIPVGIHPNQYDPAIHSIPTPAPAPTPTPTPIRSKLAICTAKCFSLYPTNPARAAICTAQCITDQEPAPTPTKCPRGDKYTPTGFEKCIVGYREDWQGWFPTRRRYCVCDPTITPTPTPPTPPTPPTQCPEGLMYDKPLLFGCKDGYVPYDPGIGQKELCICSARYAEAIGILKPGKDGDGDGLDLGLGKMSDMMPIIIGGAVAVALLSLLRK